MFIHLYECWRSFCGSCGKALPSLRCKRCDCAAVCAEEHVHLRVRLLWQHRHLLVHPHHPALQSHHHQEGHPRPQQVSESEALGRWMARSEIKRCVLLRYWEAVLEMLWPRFELILEMNIHSIRNTDPQKLGVLDTRPHYVGFHVPSMVERSVSTYVFADFRSPVVMLSFHLQLSASTRRFPTRGPTFCWDSCRYTNAHIHWWPMTESISADARNPTYTPSSVLFKDSWPPTTVHLLGDCFQVEVENFVLKMAAEFPSRRDQLIFLINNYDMMLSVLMVSSLNVPPVKLPFWTWLHLWLVIVYAGESSRWQQRGGGVPAAPAGQDSGQESAASCAQHNISTSLFHQIWHY